MGRNLKYKQKEVVAALRATKGMVYMAAERLGCEPKTVYNYAERFEAVKAEIAKQDGIVDDTAEIKLIQAIHNGESWAIKYRLSTKGKSRGYGEQQDIRHSGEVTLTQKGYTTAASPDKWDNIPGTDEQ